MEKEKIKISNDDDGGVVITASKEYNCLCTKCGNSWTSSGKPSRCPQCKNTGINYSEAKTNN